MLGSASKRRELKRHLKDANMVLKKAEVWDCIVEADVVKGRLRAVWMQSRPSDDLASRSRGGRANS